MELTQVNGKIKRLMDTVGWSEYKLAKMAGLPQSTITHLFKRNNAPTLPTVEAVCRAFNITLSQFFADEGEPVPLTEDQQTHLIAWGALSQEQRQILVSTMEQFLRD